jgi:hypothetical protein
MTPPPAQPPPTPQDAQAVSAAVAQAAQDAPTAAQARTDAAAAAQRVGEEKGLPITEEGAAPSGEPTAPAPNGAPAAAPLAEQPPRKRTFAQKFLGE